MTTSHTSLRRGRPIALLGWVLATFTLWTGCPQPPTSNSSPDTGRSDAVGTDVGADASTGDTGASPDGATTSEHDAGDAGRTDTAADSIDVRIVAVDPEGRPIEEARVELGAQSGMTGPGGGVNFVDIDPGMIWVPVVRGSRFAPGATVLRDLPDSGRVTRYVTLLPADDTRPFDAGSQARLYKDNVHIRLPADALRRPDGSPVSGTVHAAIVTPELEDGELAAVPPDRSGTMARSFGSLEVRFFNETAQGREPLRLAAGASATVELLLPDGSDDKEASFEPGDELTISAYDMKTGRWNQQLRGTVRPSSFASGRLAWRGRLSHFSWWNLRREVPADQRGCVEVKLTGSKTSGVTVAARGVEFPGAVEATTDADGTACLPVPREAKMRIAVRAGGGHVARGSTTVTTADRAACGTDGCKTVTLEMIPATCMAGTIRDHQGAAVGNATVRATWSTGYGRIGTAVRAGADGSFCTPTPKTGAVTVHAVAKSRSGMPMIGTGTVDGTGTTASCSTDSESCVSSPELGLRNVATAMRCVAPNDAPNCPERGPAARIDSIDIAGPNDNCCRNVDEKAGPDSRFPDALEAFGLASGGDVRLIDQFEKSIKNGGRHLVFEFLHLQSLHEDPSFQMALHRADRRGNDHYSPEPSPPAGAPAGSMLYRGELEAGSFRADLGQLHLPFSLGASSQYAPTLEVPLSAPVLEDARLSADGQLSAGAGLAFAGARLSGWVETEALADSFNAVTNDDCPCLDKDVFDRNLSCQVTAGDAASCLNSPKLACNLLAKPKSCATFASQARRARDVDTDGDGTADAWSFGATLSTSRARLSASP